MEETVVRQCASNDIDTPNEEFVHNGTSVIYAVYLIKTGVRLKSYHSL